MLRARGDVVVWRSIAEETSCPHPAYSIPTIVLDHQPGYAALYQPTGTVSRRHSGRRDGPRGALPPGGWDGTYEERVWNGPATIRLHRFGTGYSVIRYWTDAGWDRWYVNLEAPWTPTPIGWDSRDEVLDIVPADDLTGWRWKDEDEYTWARKAGVIDDARASLIEQRADDAIADLTDRRFPFDADWRQWTPDPAWPRPELPPKWDQITHIG